MKIQHVTGMFGLGDNIFQRAIVREMGPIHLVTSWPQLYTDLKNVECIPASTTLRTQSKNLARHWPWAVPARRYDTRMRIGYDANAGTLLERYLFSARMDMQRPITFDLPSVWPYVNIRADRPFVLVRPATVRKEWHAASRNPRPEYIAQAALSAKQNGFTVICVADLVPGEEELVGPMPYYDTGYLNGELRVEDLMWAVQHAAGVIGGVGWLLPAALAYRTPMLCVWGGWGRMNGPARVLDRRIDTSKLVRAVPDNLCGCNDSAHDCDKTITNFRRYIDEFLELASSTDSRLAA